MLPMSMMQAASAPSLPSLHFQRENLMDSISDLETSELPRSGL
jgi:hypothetical protein